MSRYAITSRTDNGTVLVISDNSNLKNVVLNKKYMVVFSDSITNSMETLSKLGIVTYALVIDGKTSPAPTPRRGRKSKEVSTDSENSEIPDENKEE